MGVVSAATAVVSLLYSAVSTSSTRRQASNSAATEDAYAAAEVAANNEATAETTAATIAEAERERAVAISNQEAQNTRIEAIASESAANERAIAQNIKERSQEETNLARLESAKEVSRLHELEAQTKGRQLAALASGGADLEGESGTAGALLLDTKTKANKDITATKEAMQSRVNLLTKTGEFAVDQGEVSAQNILDTAEHTVKTNLENVKSAGDTLVANAKISGETADSLDALENLLTLGEASSFSSQIDSLKSQANAKLWGSLLSTSSQLSSIFSKAGSTTTTAATLSNATTGSEALSLFG